MTLYRVLGPLPFRERLPGDVFETTLGLDEELRALERGNIEILDSSPTRLRPGSYVLPDGWETGHTTRAPEGALSLEGST